MLVKKTWSDQILRFVKFDVGLDTCQIRKHLCIFERLNTQYRKIVRVLRRVFIKLKKLNWIKIYIPSRTKKLPHVKLELSRIGISNKFLNFEYSFEIETQACAIIN